MSDLAAKTCEPCKGGVPALSPDKASELLKELMSWEIIDNHHLYKKYEFPDFISALGFVNKLGGVAEEQGHHPNISLTWGKVEVEIWTHKIDGLTESDFVLAAKFDRA